MIDLQKQKDALKVLADISLDIAANNPQPRNWTPDDLMHVLWLLQDISLSLSWKHLSGLTIEQRGIIAEEFGKTLRQSVTLFTGYDPAKHYYGELNAEVVE